jgi:hypothetical protein
LLAYGKIQEETGPATLQHDVSVTIQDSKQTLSQSQKYETAFQVAQKLATLASEVSMMKYQSCLTVLHRISTLWEMDKDIGNIIIEDEVNHVPYTGLLLWYNIFTKKLQSSYRI